MINGSINSKVIKQLEELLFNFSKEKYKVTIIQKLEIKSLKKQLINEIESTSNWELIKKHFPSSKISDILLKN